MQTSAHRIVFEIACLIAISLSWGINDVSGQTPYTPVAPGPYFSDNRNQSARQGDFGTSPGGYPVYTASREMVPTDPTLGAGNTAKTVDPAKVEEKKSGNAFTAFIKKTFSGSKSKESEKASPSSPPVKTADETRSGTSEAEKSETKNEKESKSFFSWWPSSSKKENLDDGQEQIDRMEHERNFSINDYFESATASKNAAQKDLYRQGMRQESQGEFNAAIRSYNAFIRANKKQIDNGTLAAPYHRLALIAWRQQRHDNADVYFRYGLRYALGGNIPVIAGDYSIFLSEQGKLEQAETILRGTLLHFPKDRRLQVSLGHSLVRQDKPVEALRYFKEALGEERAYQEVAMLYQQRGEFALAQSMMRKRDELLARSGRGSDPSLNPFQHAHTSPVRPTAPPVLAEPRGMQHKPTLVQQIPHPTLGDLKDETKPNRAARTAASGDALTTPPPTVTPPTVVPPNPAANSSLPISKVYHYPSGSAAPVYHQYVGENYPRTVPSVSVGPGNADSMPGQEYFMISTIPTPPTSVPGSPTGWGSPNPREAATPTAPIGR